MQSRDYKWLPERADHGAHTLFPCSCALEYGADSSEMAIKHNRGTRKKSRPASELSEPTSHLKMSSVHPLSHGQSL